MHGQLVTESVRNRPTGAADRLDVLLQCTQQLSLRSRSGNVLAPGNSPKRVDLRMGEAEGIDQCLELRTPCLHNLHLPVHPP